MIIDDDLTWMRHALDLAQRAEAQGEVPVGAVLIAADGTLLAEGWNQPVSAHDPSAHAEMWVMRDAARRINNYRLNGATLYVTLEPCIMCAGAMVHARIRRLVYAADDPKSGAVNSLYQILADSRLNHQVLVEQGVLAEAAGDLLRTFFRKRRG